MNGNEKWILYKVCKCFLRCFVKHLFKRIKFANISLGKRAIYAYPLMTKEINNKNNYHPTYILHNLNLNDHKIPQFQNTIAYFLT